MYEYACTFTNGKHLTVTSDSVFGATQTAKFHAFRLCTSLDTLRVI